MYHGLSVWTTVGRCRSVMSMVGPMPNYVRNRLKVDKDVPCLWSDTRWASWDTYPWLGVCLWSSWGVRLALFSVKCARLSDVPHVDTPVKQVRNVRNQGAWRGGPSCRTCSRVGSVASPVTCGEVVYPGGMGHTREVPGGVPAYTYLDKHLYLRFGQTLPNLTDSNQ